MPAKFRALLKQQLFELLSECFLEWLEVREQSWTKQRCPHCHRPYAFQDALYCAWCGIPLQGEATEPALCAIDFAPEFAPPIQPITDPLYLPPGSLARAVFQEARPDIGPHTQITRALHKMHLQSYSTNEKGPQRK